MGRIAFLLIIVAVSLLVLVAGVVVWHRVAKRVARRTMTPALPRTLAEHQRRRAREGSQTTSWRK